MFARTRDKPSPDSHYDGCRTAPQPIDLVRFPAHVVMKTKRFRARVVESADTRDLKSLAPCGRAGSTPAPGTRLWILWFLVIRRLTNLPRFFACQAKVIFGDPDMKEVGQGLSPSLGVIHRHPCNRVVWGRRRTPFPTALSGRPGLERTIRRSETIFYESHIKRPIDTDSHSLAPSRESSSSTLNWSAI